MRGLQFLLQFFLVFKYNGNGPAHTQMQRRPHCTTGVAFSVPPPAARRTHVAKTGAALCLTSRPSEQTRRIAFCGCRAAKVDQNKIPPPRGGHTQALVTRSAEEFPPRFDAH